MTDTVAHTQDEMRAAAEKRADGAPLTSQEALAWLAYVAQQQATQSSK